MSITQEQVQNKLRLVVDPKRKIDIVEAGWVQHIAICDGFIKVKLTDVGPSRDALGQIVTEAVKEIGEEVAKVTIEWAAAADQQGKTRSEDAAANNQSQPSMQDTARQSNPLPGVKHIIAVGAGKGGVGKSTIAVNLAIGLARVGKKVGLLDGDIYGPSVPTLLALHDDIPRGTDQIIYPFFTCGIKTMTIGKLVDPEKALIWRGPMAHGAFRQLALQTDWGELDYLVIDLPPGTGDVCLTLAQMLPLDGAVIVCTPQRVAQDDAVRAVRMFEQLDIPVLGVVENMSYFIGDDGKEYDIFGKGGAASMAGKLNLPMLGTVPIHMELRANSDSGTPLKNFEGNPQLSGELNAMVQTTIKAIDERHAARPTLSIS